MAVDSLENTSTSAESGPVQGSKAPGKRPTIIALAALLIALLALALAAWIGLRQLQLIELPGQVGVDAGKLSEVERHIVQLSESLSQQGMLIADIETSLADDLGTLEKLPARLEQVEQGLASVPGIDPKSRKDWLTAEAIYFMRIANAQAVLAGNAEVASSALVLADEKLRDLGDPSFDSVRQALSDEITALQALPAIDRTGISFRLQSLMTQANDWPFRELAPDSFSPDTVPPAGEFGPWNRFVATLKSVVDGIISIKESETPTISQLGATERGLVLESIKAELQIARLAFIANNKELFAQSLEKVEQQVGKHMNTDAASVSAALESLGELRAVEIPGTLPDISGSMGLLLERVGNSEVQ